ncbi:hypothetical protein [Pseudomonas amygdali]|uniref:Uncharacterized protein n=2 Tax=Pseudomonas amygdali pv. lachrymans TaxID=53707 RepID=A0ABR5KR76_PSEAV|nr:hypothetical protein [Pseudomonas amygdali]AXH59887.1 hypothetical protein PLA107_032190 [Pseudomonas amygdali pv. lachrymans str. M301315]KPC17299.1 Uncharacterized protein AC499_0501 [Pseudomonas amygdali pv. lachrymans]RMT05690.1 hypothetical protein ALP54_03762 [Pseudomonas amygdali pv. lachrymans]
MITQPEFSQILEIFSQNGSGAIDICKSWELPATQPEYLSFGSVEIKCNLLPLVAAHFSGFGSVQLANLIISLDLELEDFLADIKYLVGDDLSFSDKKFSLVDFLRKSLDAFLIAKNCWSHESAMPKCWINLLHKSLSRSGQLALAITLLGRKDVSFLTWQREQLEIMESSGEPLENSNFQAAFATNRALAAWPINEHYSQAQIADILQGFGALDASTIKNVTGQSGLWSRVIFDLCENKHFEAMLDFVLSRHPGLALPIVRSLDFYSAFRFDETPATLANSLDSLLKKLKLAGLEGALEPLDVIVNLANAGICDRFMNDPDQDPFHEISEDIKKSNEPQLVFQKVFPEDLEIHDYVSVLSGKSCLALDLMKAHLETPIDQIPLAYFNQWQSLSWSGLIRGDISSELTTRFLAHMAKAALALKLNGHERIHVLRKNYDHLDQCMRELVGSLDESIETEALMQEHEEVRIMLALWGLDPRRLGIVSGKAIDRWFAGDLGL